MYTVKQLQDLQGQYSPTQTRDKLTTLTDQLNSIHTSDAKVNISELSSEVAYLSQQLELKERISHIINNLLEAHETLQNVKSGENDTSGTTSEEAAELHELAQLEITELTPQLEQAIDELNKLAIKRKLSDPDDSKNVILEIRAGAGGEEAAIFAADLLRMYSNYANKKGWKLTIISISNASAGGIKEVIATISGKNIYGSLKYESGVHRVQRIPQTESSGRIHTSTASVIILPEAQEIDIKINPEDIRVDAMRASGAGGQHVNKTTSAIRITHIPTGITAFSQESRVQQENRKLAMLILKTRLYELEKSKKQSEESGKRKTLVGSGDRSEKIRTYNYPQSRVTDHRIKKSWHNLEEILDGELDTLIQDVISGIQEQNLAALDS